MFEVTIILKISTCVYSLQYVSKKQKHVSDAKIETDPYGLRFTSLTFNYVITQFMDCPLLTIKPRMNSKDIVKFSFSFTTYFHYLS